MSQTGRARGNGHEAAAAAVGERRPFRAADVLTGSIDKRLPPPGRPRKQISAQLEPAQLRLLGELHARLNATATGRIEKSDLVGLGIELLAAVLAEAEEELDPAPDEVAGNGHGGGAPGVIADVGDLRLYLRTHVRAYAARR